jgi:hypothetical protein
MNHAIQGVLPVVHTPFDERERVDFDTLARAGKAKAEPHRRIPRTTHAVSTSRLHKLRPSLIVPKHLLLSFLEIPLRKRYQPSHLLRLQASARLQPLHCCVAAIGRE